MLVRAARLPRAVHCESGVNSLHRFGAGKSSRTRTCYRGQRWMRYSCLQSQNRAPPHEFTRYADEKEVTYDRLPEQSSTRAPATRRLSRRTRSVHQPNRVPAHSRSYSSSWPSLSASGVIGAGMVATASTRSPTPCTWRPTASSHQYFERRESPPIHQKRYRKRSGSRLYPGAEQGKGGVRMTIAGKTMITANFLTLRLQGPGDRVLPKQPGPDAQQAITTGYGRQFVTMRKAEYVTVTVTQSRASNGGRRRSPWFVHLQQSDRA